MIRTLCFALVLSTACDKAGHAPRATDAPASSRPSPNQDPRFDLVDHAQLDALCVSALLGHGGVREYGALRLPSKQRLPWLAITFYEDSTERIAPAQWIARSERVMSLTRSTWDSVPATRDRGQNVYTRYQPCAGDEVFHTLLTVTFLSERQATVYAAYGKHTRSETLPQANGAATSLVFDAALTLARTVVGHPLVSDTIHAPSTAWQAAAAPR